MSRNTKNCPTPLNIHEINKRILKKEEKQRLEYECLGHNNKYRDENYRIYETKKRQFLEAGRQYQEMNRLALLNDKVKLEDAYYKINFDFLDEEFEEDIINNEKYTSGCMLRKRTERPFNEVPNIEKEVCMTEPWLRRYLVLNKFIQAARSIIYKNRLLKNLEILRSLDEEKIMACETNKKQCYNVSYQDIFDKYL